MTRRAIFALAALALLVAAPGAAPGAHPAAKVEIGHVTLSAPTLQGGAALLVPVHYPIHFSGRVMPLTVQLREPGGRLVRSFVLHERIGAGLLRIGERRRRFTFVHRVGLTPALAGQVREGLEVKVKAGGMLDVNEDGKPEMVSRDETAPAPALLAPGNGRLCSSIPRLRIGHGKSLSIPLPACTASVRWRIAGEPDAGRAQIKNGRLVYHAATSFRGTTGLVLRGRPREVGAISVAAEGEAGVPAPVQIFVGPPSGVVVRAMGDSVTAGFGYYGTGEPMPFLSLDECRPSASYNDACSSNSEVDSSSFKIFEYARDWGLVNNVSWAAQWANGYGITNYENLAISGSEPRDWAPGGRLYEITQQIESEDPDYVLMTIGANPLLEEVLFGIDNMGCAVYADVFGNYAQCIEKAFAGVQLQANLKNLYGELVKNTKATIFLMQYPLSVPSSALAYSATQIAEMVALLDGEIAKAAGEVNPQRLQVVSPPHFNVGISVEPVFPAKYVCSLLEFRVDGASVQSESTQDELEVLHPLSFCPGPPLAGPYPAGPPWVISGDTGIHPSAAGYAQMAAQVPAPE